MRKAFILAVLMGCGQAGPQAPAPVLAPSGGATAHVTERGGDRPTAPGHIAETEPARAERPPAAPSDAGTARLPPASGEDLPPFPIDPPTGSCRCRQNGVGWFMAGPNETNFPVDYGALCDIDAQTRALLSGTDARVQLHPAERARLARRVAAGACVLPDSDDLRIGPFRHINGGEGLLNFVIQQGGRQTWLSVEWDGSRWLVTKIETIQLRSR